MERSPGSGSWPERLVAADSSGCCGNDGGGQVVAGLASGVPLACYSTSSG